jgi:hypothetical protein
LFFVRITGVMMTAILSNAPMAPAELCLNVTDFLITPA